MTARDKGSDREIVTAAYFQSYGFLVRQGVKLAIAAGTSEVTDIDVLALRYNVPLEEERVVIDCKERKKPKPFERILWTVGLSTFAQANRSVVVLPSAPWQAREFASRVKVEVLCVPEMEKHLASVSDANMSFGQANLNFMEQLEKNQQSIQDKGKSLLIEDLQIRQMLVRGNPVTNFNRIIQSLSRLGGASYNKGSALDWLKCYIACNAAITAGVMLARFATESKWTPEDDWTDNARKRLTYGDISPQKANQLAKLALDHEHYGSLPKPPYTEEIIHVLRLLILNPRLTSLIPFSLDFQLFGKTMGKLPEKYVAPVLQDSYNELIKINKQILSVLAYAAGISNEIWTLEGTKDSDSVKQNQGPGWCSGEKAKERR